MAEAPVFSVVIAAHNAARTLPSTIRSVLAQTRQGFEIVVVDDGSTDGTDEALRGVPDDRISYIRQVNLGPAAARNAGIERAAGEYVCLLDSDDLWLPDYLERMGAALEADPGAGLAYTDAWRLDDVTRRVRRWTTMRSQRPPRRPPAQREALLAAMLERNFVYTSATVRRQVLDDVGGFKTFTRSEDYELWLRIAASGTRFVNAGKVLAVYRDRPGSRMDDPVAMVRGRAEILEHVLATYDLTEADRSVVEKRLQEATRELAILTGNEAEAAPTETRTNGLWRLAYDLRLYRFRTPRAVLKAFPDLSAI
jgi:glycosyltransferase involved in cell wall biosynthesis